MKYESQLQRLSANVPSALNVEVSRVKTKLVPLKLLLQELEVRHERTVTALNQQSEEVWKLQEEVNYEFEKALLAEKMLEAGDLLLPLPVKESDIFAEYKALCARHCKVLGGDDMAWLGV